MKSLLWGFFVVVVAIVLFILATSYFNLPEPNDCCELLEVRIAALEQEINFQHEQIKRIAGRDEVLSQRLVELSSKTRELEKRLPIKWKAK